MNQVRYCHNFATLLRLWTLLACVAVAAAQTGHAPPSSESTKLSPTEQSVFDLHNIERAKAGLAAFRLDGVLTALARQRAEDMATRNYFSHTTPTGETVFTLLAGKGYKYSVAGENIARNESPEIQAGADAMKAFMNSPGHRENILEAHFTSIGVGVAVGKDGSRYFAIVFAGR